MVEEKGLKYKDTWEAWGPAEFTLDDGNSWTFGIKKPEEGLVIAGGECGPLETIIFLGHDNHIKQKLLEKAGKLQAYLCTPVSVVDVAAKAYHAERLASRVLKETARSRAQYVLRVFPPEITEEPNRIPDAAVMDAERALPGWTKDEMKKALPEA